MLVVVVIVALFERDRRLIDADVSETPFTSFEGDEQSASFSPDGREVVFTWARPPGTPDIFFKPIDSENVRPFVVTDAIEKGPVFSPDGRFVAFIRVGFENSSVIVKPRDGGPERLVTQCDNPHPTMIGSPGPYVAWTRDSSGLIYTHRKSLHLWRLSESRAIRLTDAPAGAQRGDVDPALSPEGRTLVFVRDTNTGSSALYRLQLNNRFEPAGAPAVLLSNGNWNRSPAWHRNGRTLLFNAGQWGRQRLWSLNIDRPSAARAIAGAGSDSQQPAISPATGDVLFTRWFFRQQIWTLPLSGPGRSAGTLRPLFTSTRADAFPRFSRDGEYIVFQSDRTGAFEVWMSRADGSEPRRLTSFAGAPAGAPDISPDGKWIVFSHLVAGQRDLYVSDVHGGNLRRLTNHPADDALPRWSADGKSLYFASQRDGGDAVYRMDIEAGRTVRITPGRGLMAEESPDGQTLYFTEGEGFSTDLYAMPVSSGPARLVIRGVRHRGMTVSSSGIYYIPAHSPDEIRFLDTRAGEDTLVLKTSEHSLQHLACDAAQRTLAVVVDGPPSGDLMLIRGLAWR